jgi:hypothetical protein
MGKTRYACKNLAGILVDLEDETMMEDKIR